MKVPVFFWLAATVGFSAGLSLPLNAQTTQKTYAQHLVDETVAKHPEVLALVMHATPPNSADNVIVASNIGGIGKKADEDDLKVINTGRPKLEVSSRGERFEVELVLQEVAGNPIGALAVAFPYHSGDDQGRLEQKAEQIRDELRRQVIELSNLMEPYPYDPRVSSNTYAQHLVDETLAKHPEVLILAMHAIPPGVPDSVIVASNFGRIGKRDDEGDLRVIRTGKPNLAVNRTGDRFNLALPLQDVFRNTIGLLTIAFPYKAGDDKARFMKMAEQVQDELRRRVIELENLAEPFPYDAQLSSRTYGQKLVDEMLEKYPQLLILAMHITPPNSLDNVIVASNFGRIGKKSDEADLRLIQSGKHNMAVNKAGDRFSGQLMLKNVAGETIGSLAVVFPYKAGDDKAQLLTRSEQIRDELMKKIASSAMLVAPAQ